MTIISSPGPRPYLVYFVYLAIIAAALAIFISRGLSAPSLAQIKQAMQLYPGRSTDISVNGQILHVIYLGVESRGHGRYAVIVEVR